MTSIPKSSTVAEGLEGTRACAQALAQELEPGTVVALVGELGAGKTSFVQGLAEGLGVEDLGQVLSPTYSLSHEYNCRGGRLVHMDFYRLTDADQAHGLGLEDAMADPSAIVAVEWADHLRELIPPKAIWVHLIWVDSDHRRIEVSPG